MSVTAIYQFSVKNDEQKDSDRRNDSEPTAAPIPWKTSFLTRKLGVLAMPKST
jgi:hypothetical protein